jgi:predicted TIM-barrel fold metal-dependent hydrolase
MRARATTSQAPCHTIPAPGLPDLDVLPLVYTRTFLDLYLEMGADRIMFSTDYPYSSRTQARDFLDRLP